MSTSTLKIAGAVLAIAAGAVVLHSSLPKAEPGSGNDEIPFAHKVIGILLPIGAFASYVAELAQQGIEAFSPAQEHPAAEPAAPNQV